MSRLVVGTLEGMQSKGNIITVPDGHKLAVPSGMHIPGHVVQVVAVRTDLQQVISGLANVGAEIQAMRVTITPKFSNSMLLFNFMVNGENSTHDFVFTVFKNGSIATGTYPGYNAVQGDVSWSGVVGGLPYDSTGNYDTTPFSTQFSWIDFPGVTTPVIYAPGFRGSTVDAASTLCLNRTATSTGASYRETGISIATVMEIAQ